MADSDGYMASMISALQNPGTANFINPAYATPKQREQIYAYANELMKPQPVHNALQGVGELARALVGGWQGHQADVGEQAAVANAAQQWARTAGRIMAPGTEDGTMMSGRSAAVADGNNPDVGSLIDQSASKYGIDPGTARKFFGVESGLNPAAIGDNGTSFGVPQLHYTGDPKHPAMGDQFTAETGLDARDPGTTPQQIDYALKRASQEGWGAWKNTRDKLGADNFTGIGQAPIQTGRSASITAGPRGQLPASAEDIGLLMANPNISDEQKRMAVDLLRPQTHETATGQVVPSYQYQPAGAPIVNKGVLREQTPNSVPAIVSGNPQAPQNNIAPPQVPGATSVGLPGAPQTGQSPVSIFAPSSVLGQMRIGQAQTEAAAGATTHAAGASTEQYTNDLREAANFPRSSLPLTKAIPLLEHLGQTGTGVGSDAWNQAMSLLQTMRVPISDPNNIKAFDEAKKYLTDYVNQTGNSGTNDKLAAAFAGNPSVHISNAAAIDVAKTALAMQRFKQAQILSYGNQPPEGYAKHAAQFAQTMDPRAFGLDLMAPEARKALFASLPKKPDSQGRETNQERIRFLNSLQAAHDTGMVQMPGQ
jgi:hypothetical protein